MKVLPFYIIIIPGTLKFLKFAIWSMQQRPDIDITLVANGLGSEEGADMKKLGAKLGCDTVFLTAKNMLSHGAALNQLLTIHQSPWFCFCDSDIISNHEIGVDIFSEVGDMDALSSCDAMFWDNSPVEGLLGRCNRWPDGSRNMSSFFCIYKTEVIKGIMKKYNVGFENIKISEISSSSIKKALEKKGITSHNKKLDTGKALTVALELEGNNFAHKEIDSLLHIGGLSSWIYNGPKELVHTEYTLTDEDLFTLAGSESWLFNPLAHINSSNSIFYLRRQQRLAAARYCFQLISHYIERTPKPRHYLVDENFIIKINKVEKILKEFLEVKV